MVVLQKWIRLHTEVPGPGSRELLAVRERFVPKGVANTAPIFVTRAEGALVEDVDGNRFIDFAGGIGTLNLGSSHPEVVAAIQQQAANFTHTCFHVSMYEPYVRLAERLVALVPGNFEKKVFLVNSGAEAVENAVKVARKYTGRPTVIALENAFHGRTLLGLTLTSKAHPYKHGFGPFAPEVYRIPSPYCYRCPFALAYPGCGLYCADNLERVLSFDLSPEQVAAVVVEPVQGEGGFIVPPPGYLAKVAQICRKRGIPLIVDEIQTGFGRTGRMLAVEHEDVEPEIIVLAKSLGAGLPIAAVVGRTEILDAAQVGGLGGTYGGNPVAAAAALKVLEIMRREDYAELGRHVGARVRERFEAMQKKYPLVGDVRGLGAMVAMELVRDRRTKVPAAEETAQVIKLAYERGLITIKAGVYNNVLRFLAPLSIKSEQLEEGLDVLEGALADVEGKV